MKPKHIDEHYKDWCGESHITNSCHPVHDSAECTDFAEYYAKQMQDSTIEQKSTLCQCLNEDMTGWVELKCCNICGKPIREHGIEGFIGFPKDSTIEKVKEQPHQEWYPVEYAGRWSIQTGLMYGDSDILDADDVGYDQANKNANQICREHGAIEKVKELRNKYEKRISKVSVIGYEEVVEQLNAIIEAK